MSTTQVSPNLTTTQGGGQATQTPRRKGQALRWLRETSWRHLVAWVGIVFAAFPVMYILSVSLNPAATMTGSNKLFTKFDLHNYQALFQSPQHPYGKWFMNTLVIATVTALATVMLGAAAAYAFSRFRFTGRRGGLVSLMVLQMFPQTLAYVAIFLLLLTFRDTFPILGLGSQLGLIMVYLGGALGVNTYLMYGFFNTVPREIDEAAKIDGAGHARIFFSIILRLVSPILAVVGLLSFISSFSEFLIASIILTKPESQTLAVGMYQFVSQRFSENWGLFAAGAILAALPVVLLFQFLQRFIVSGLSAGGVKG